jgi:uncharacterized protein involved in exopolysaccharide biosynthesis
MQEDEIDLGKYVKVLIRHWKLIAGLTFIAGLAAFAISFTIAPTYEATAVIVITQDRYRLQFDPRIQTLPEQPPYRAFPELAESNDLLTLVIDTLGDRLKPGERDPLILQRRLSAKAGADPSLLSLSAVSKDPQEAQAIANAWASAYFTYTNELYQQGSSDAAFFAKKTNEARIQLDTTEQALVNYQASNPIISITAQLNDKQAANSYYLTTIRTNALDIQDARDLQQLLTQQNPTDPLLLSDQLATLYLQIDALNVNTTVPVQLQIVGGMTLTNRTVAQQTASLNALVKTLEAKSDVDRQLIEALQPDILRLQQAQQAAQVNLNRLTRERDVAFEAYQALTRKVNETSITAQNAGGGGIKVASLAALPIEPVSPRKGVNMLLGGFLGLVLGAISAFVIEAWRTHGKEPNKA